MSDLCSSVLDQANRHLHAAIESLPPLPRTLLTLYHLEELSIPEISRITGIAEGTTKSHLFRSRKQLRAILESTIAHTASTRPDMTTTHARGQHRNTTREKPPPQPDTTPPPPPASHRPNRQT